MFTSPTTEAVTLKVAAFTTAIPPGSFQKTQGKWYGRFVFRGVIDGVALNVVIEPTGANRYALRATAHGANLTGTTSPAPVTLTIGDDTGTASANARSGASVARSAKKNSASTFDTNSRGGGRITEGQSMA